MERLTYPQLIEQPKLPQISPALQKTVAPAYFPAQNEHNNVSRTHWAEVCNIIVLILEGVFLAAYGYYLATVNNLPIFGILVAFQLIAFALNTAWYFDKSNPTLIHLLSIVSYISFAELVFGIIFVIALIQGTMVDQVQAILLALFVILPTFVLGLSIWVLLKERTFLLQAGFGGEINHQYSLDQESIKTNGKSLEEQFKTSSEVIGYQRMIPYYLVQ